MLHSFFFFLTSLYAFDTVSSLVVGDLQEGNHHVPIGWREGKPLRLPPGLHFKTEYFDYPGLKDILSAISNSRKLADQEPRSRAEVRKRQIDRDNLAAFALRVNPVIPRNPLSVRNYSRFCKEKKTWCAELPTPKPKICPEADTPTPVPRTCGPTKPTVTANKYVYCNFDKPPPTPGRDPCEECTSPAPTSPEYVPCISHQAPTAFARLRLCSPTTSKCQLVPCTYRSVMPLETPPPPTPPSCDIGSLVALRNPESRYYVLVKRSPGDWRVKRSRPRKRFRIISETI